MKILRVKGSSLPILIRVEIRYPDVRYFLNNKKSDFEHIRDFLFLSKSDLIAQLNSIYKHKSYLRFLFGNQFRSIIKNLNLDSNKLDFLRYILNKTNNKDIIKDGKVAYLLKVEDYVQHYKIYNENSFDIIFKYLISLFENNDTSLQKHYENMLIKSKNKYKGIYSHKCVNESAEEFILKMFLDKIGQLPIEQNILICNKETSQEEMQAFLSRAILCDYNTLFLVKIINSFTEFQYNIMCTYIDSLLKYKYEKYKENGNKNVEKTKTEEYLNSCIIFVYEENINYFLSEIKRFELEGIGYKLLRFEKKDQYLEDLSLNNSHDKSLLENIKVITSDICGLGKSFLIKKIIKTQYKRYFHFPLGGKLTKTIIFKKLYNLLKKIKNQNENNYQEVAIHLDLIESKETSILSEFLFSFLITRFYSNNGNIIYIPKDIDIYIEIPNCFENYISKIGILNAFTRENIKFDNIPKLELTQTIIAIFNRHFGLNSNDKIEEFIQKYIDINKYSYHQLIIFIKLFISQYSKFESKLTFKEGQKDLTDIYIRDFANCAKYFVNGILTKLLMSININDRKDYFDLLSENYNNNLNEKKIDITLIFINKVKKTFHKLIISKTEYKEYKSTKKYLAKIKEILDIPNDVEKDIEDKKSLLSILNYRTDNYVITNDNFKKMVFLLYIIQANVPVIIMGETGCGKTELIIKLNQILNNGEITAKIIKYTLGLLKGIYVEK